jgi:pimeloyl-ACP methyl ester carboxylesterase
MKRIYLHGLPGGAAELALAGVTLPVLDRRGKIDLPQGPLHLVGFSLGAAKALQLAAQHPDKIARLTLISPAAPLELGNFLPDMAGQAVFKAARNRSVFHALTMVQAGMVRLAPGLLARQLIATCDASDRALLISTHGAPIFRRILQQGYGANRPAFLREVPHYVRPWAQGLARVTCPMTLHHGIADTWAPPAMTKALANALPQAEVQMHEGLGHYTSLVEALKNP